VIGHLERGEFCIRRGGRFDFSHITGTVARRLKLAFAVEQQANRRAGRFGQFPAKRPSAPMPNLEPKPPPMYSQMTSTSPPADPSTPTNCSCTPCTPCVVAHTTSFLSP
jgi:hypothetical protein